MAVDPSINLIVLEVVGFSTEAGGCSNGQGMGCICGWVRQQEGAVVREFDWHYGYWCWSGGSMGMAVKRAH